MFLELLGIYALWRLGSVLKRLPPPEPVVIEIELPVSNRYKRFPLPRLDGQRNGQRVPISGH